MPKPIYALSFGDRRFLLSQKTFKQKLKPPLSALFRLNMGAVVATPNRQIEIFAVWPHEQCYEVFAEALGKAPVVEF